MDVFDIEGDAIALTAMAGLDPDNAHSIRSLCLGLTGHPPIITPLIIGGGEVVCINGIRRIAVSSKLSAERQRWVVGHELAHVYYQNIGHDDGCDLEARCDLLGAVLCAPRRVVYAARKKHGNDPRTIARVLGVTQTLALLRLGEIGAVEGAAVSTPSRLLARGQIVWPGDEELRQAIRKGIPNGKLVRITDEPRRSGMIIEE